MQLNSATNIQVKEVIPVTSGASGTTNSLEIDTLGWQEALIIVSCGSFTATGTLAVKVQDTLTSGTGYADVTGAAFASITDALDDRIHVARIKFTPYTNGTTDKVERYIRVVGTQATAATVYGVTVILMNRSMPAAFDGVVNAVGVAGTAAALAFNID